jgi:hypothetical protein
MRRHRRRKLRIRLKRKKLNRKRIMRKQWKMLNKLTISQNLKPLLQEISLKLKAMNLRWMRNKGINSEQANLGLEL